MVGEMSRDIVTSGTLDRPAVMGKLPAHGDFITRGLDHRLRDRLDRWLSAWVNLAREQLGEAFEPAWCAAAPWLFEGAQAHAVLMPSMDAAGRLFPVLALADAGCATQAIYDHVIAAIEQGLDGDGLIARLEAIAPVAPDEARSEGRWFLPDGAQQILPPPGAAPGWDEAKEVFG